MIPSTSQLELDRECGDITSPLLMRDTKWGGEETMVYADVVAVVADSIEEPRQAVNRWNLAMNHNGKKINTRITEFMKL